MINKKVKDAVCSSVVCRGCKIHETYTLCKCEPSLYHFGTKMTCPCLTCIVKMICEDACDDLLKYARHFTLSHKSLLRR